MAETTTDLEILLPDGENLTPEEMLIAKVTLGIKVIRGLTSRLESLCINDLGKDDDGVADKIESYVEGLRESDRYINRVIREYALQQGVSLERYEQIYDMVYSRETEI